MMAGYRKSFLFIAILLGTELSAFCQQSVVDSLQKLADQTPRCQQPCWNDTIYLGRLNNLFDAQLNASSMKTALTTASQGLGAADSLMQESNAQMKTSFLLYKGKFTDRKGRVLYIMGHADSALKYYFNALAIFKSLRDSLSIAGNLNGIAIVYTALDKNDSAIYYNFRALAALGSKPDQHSLLEIYQPLAIVYRKIGAYDKAIEFGLDALKIAENSGDEVGKARVENSLFGIYKDMQEYDKAKEYLLQSYRWCKKTNNDVGLGFTATNLGILYNYLNKGDSALQYSKEGMQAKLRTSNIAATSSNYEVIGTFYANKKQYDSAAWNYLKEAALAEQYKKGEVTQSAYNMLGQMYLSSGNYALAEKYFFKGIALSGLHSEFYSALNEGLSKVYEKAGDYAKALLYYKQYKIADDSMNNEQVARNITKEELTAIYEKEKAQQQEAAAQQQAMEEQKVQTQETLRNYILVALIASLIIAGLLYNRYRIKQRTTSELEAKNKIILQQREHAEKLREEAEEGKRIKEQFLANMSHEIRTPMTAIKGITELLSDKSLDEESSRYVQAIKHSSEHLLVILNDILDVSKIQAGKFFIQQVPFELKQQVTLVYETLKVLADEKGIDFKLQYDETIPQFLKGDAVRIGQVLYNLCSNAIKFTEKGIVKLEVRSKKLDELSDPKASFGFGLLTFDISDTGIGIPKEKQAEIFESFTQLNSVRRSQTEGTGLGLTISKLLVDLMGGTITLKSAEGLGSEFIVELSFPVPAMHEITEMQLADDGLLGSSLAGLKVLIAEDNRYNQLVLRDTLVKKISNVHIDIGHNGKEVLDLLKRNDYDIILMDLRMPVMDGIATAEYIRHQMQGPKRSVPILALTASVLRTDLEKCMSAGINGYITKPFNRNELFNKMAMTLKRKNSLSSTVAAETKKSTANDEKFIDLTYLQSFTDGDPEEMRHYLKEFISIIPERMESMQEYLNAQDFQRLAELIHSMKPLLISMGIHSALLNHDGMEMTKNEEYFQEANQLNIAIRNALREIKSVYESEFAA